MTAIPLISPYPPVGDVIDGKYRVVKYLGEGGMGAVAKAEHLLRGVPVALKFMAPHVLGMEGGVERFLNEARLASQVKNDAIVEVVDVGKLPTGAPYLVMEYLEGEDLADVLDANDRKGLEVARAVHLALQILRALQAAHAKGIVHRDLKPANCFVIRKDGEADVVKLLDFGISKAPTSVGLTHTNTALGTPLYMSPEQARNPKDVDARADLYSAGVILYELLSGRTPHVSESGEATELILKLFTQDPAQLASLRPELPKALCEAVHKALVREREERWSDARAFAEAIAPFADERSAIVLQRIRGFVPSAEPADAGGGLDAFAKLSATPPTAQVQSHPPPPFDPRSGDALAATQSTRDVSPAARTSVEARTEAPPPPASGVKPTLMALAVVLTVALGVALYAAWRIVSTPVVTPQPVPTTPPTTPSVIVVTAPPPSQTSAPPTSATVVRTAPTAPPTAPSSAPSASHAPPPATTTPDLGSLRPHN